MVTLNHVPRHLAAAAKRETQGEIIRWIGQPSPGTSFSTATPIWLMGVPWSALTFTIFGVLVAAVLSGPPPQRAVPAWEYAAMVAALLFTGAFALLGAGMMLAPFWAAWKAHQTIHVITDKRLVTIAAGRATRIVSVLPREIRSLVRTERTDGGGSLRIVTGYGRDSDGDNVERSETLIGVPEVAKAERLLRELQAQTPPAS